AIAPLAEILAGWGSNNKYSLYGGVRAAALDVSYEIPMVFAVASILLITGSLATNDIVNAQHNHLWFFLPQIIGFGLFFITALARFLGPFTGLRWFLAKSLLLSFFFFWVWITMPRVRVDQYLSVAWKVMLPLSIVNFVLTAVLIKLGVLA